MQGGHLRQGACALILDLVVAQIQLCELVVCVLLQRARQLLGTCTSEPFSAFAMTVGSAADIPSQ